MEKIFFVSGNAMKAEEAGRILSEFGIEIEHRPVDIEEVQEKDAETVARKKAVEAYKELRTPLIVEDTALNIAAMNGYPGTMVKHFLHSIGTHGIVDYLNGKDRKADAVTVVAFCDSKGNVTTFKGKTSGCISEKVADGKGFAWDMIFIPEGYESTYSEIGKEEKNRISQRRKALEEFAQWLNEKKTNG